jgi:serine/threonine-protein kinase RsbW
MFKNIDELPEGGWGITLMFHLSDELSYTRIPEQKNCLSIVKNYQQQGLDQSQFLQKVSVLEWFIEFFKGLNWFKYKRQRQQLCNSPIQKIHLQVNTELKELAQVLQWFNQLEHLPISQTLWSQCQLVLAEGFTNAVRHAHKNLPLETPIELEVTVFNERLEIKIWDYGQPFDLEAKLSELKKLDQDPLEQEGGRGISIMKQVADQVSYTQISDEQNCLVIVKHLPLSSSSGEDIVLGNEN